MGPYAVAFSVLKASSQPSTVLAFGENGVLNYCKFFFSENLLVNNLGEGVLNS